MSNTQTSIGRKKKNKKNKVKKVKSTKAPKTTQKPQTTRGAPLFMPPTYRPQATQPQSGKGGKKKRKFRPSKQLVTRFV